MGLPGLEHLPPSLILSVDDTLLVGRGKGGREGGRWPLGRGRGRERPCWVQDEVCIGRGQKGWEKMPETKGSEHLERKEKRRKRGEGRREKGLLIGTIAPKEVEGGRKERLTW